MLGNIVWKNGSMDGQVEYHLHKKNNFRRTPSSLSNRRPRRRNPIEYGIWSTIVTEAVVLLFVKQMGLKRNSSSPFCTHRVGQPGSRARLSCLAYKESKCGRHYAPVHLFAQLTQLRQKPKMFRSFVVLRDVLNIT